MNCNNVIDPLSFSQSLELLAIDFDKATTVQKEFYFALSENEIPQTFGPKFVKPLEGSNSGPEMQK